MHMTGVNLYDVLDVQPSFRKDISQDFYNDAVNAEACLLWCATPPTLARTPEIAGMPPLNVRTIALMTLQKTGRRVEILSVPPMPEGQEEPVEDELPERLSKLFAEFSISKITYALPRQLSSLLSRYPTMELHAVQDLAAYARILLGDRPRTFEAAVKALLNVDILLPDVSDEQWINVRTDTAAQQEIIVRFMLLANLRKEIPARLITLLGRHGASALMAGFDLLLPVAIEARMRGITLGLTDLLNV